MLGAKKIDHLSMSVHENFSREGLGDMASAEREPITGYWDGELPAGFRGRVAGQNAKPPEADSFDTDTERLPKGRLKTLLTIRQDRLKHW